MLDLWICGLVHVAGVAHVAYANVGREGPGESSPFRFCRTEITHVVISQSQPIHAKYENLQLKLRVHTSRADHVSR
jgi:hypothetical protein